MRNIWGMPAVAVLALTGCAMPATQPTQDQSSTTEVSASASPTVSGSLESDRPASTSTEAAIGASVCKDKPGDSKSEAVDIDVVRLLSNGGLMFMDFTTVADVPTTGTVLYSVTAWSTDGKTGYQLAAKFQDGTEVANFAFSLTTSQQENVTNRAVAADKRVSSRYPLSMLKGLGGTFQWSGTVTVDGDDVDRCPDGTATGKFQTARAAP